MAALAARAKARDLVARTVHIKIHPTARSLAERREVLRVLERYGEVVMFRSLKVGEIHKGNVQPKPPEVP